MVLVGAVLLLVLVLALIGVGTRAAWRRGGGPRVLLGGALVLLLGGALAAAVALYTPHPRFDGRGGGFSQGLFPDER